MKKLLSDDEAFLPPLLPENEKAPQQGISP
jgi:hypothetical protein